MSLKSNAVSGVRWTSLSAVIVHIFQFFTLAILSRILSPSDFGLMGMAMVVTGFAKIFADMGISNAVIFRQNITDKELSSLYILNILSGIAIFVILCVITPMVIAFYHEPRLENMVYLTASGFLITPFGQQFQILLQKELRFEKLAFADITEAIVSSAVAVLLSLRGIGVFSIIWGQLAGTVFRVILLIGHGQRLWHPSLHFRKQDVKGYVGFGLYQMGEKTINYFNSNADYLLIGYMLGAKALGYYTLAYNLVLKPSMMINPVMTKVAFPVFAKLAENTDKLRNGYLKVIELLSFVNFPMMAGLAATAPVAVPVIFGEQWLPSVVLVRILTIVGLLRSVGNPVGSLMLAKGKADWGFGWNAALMITQIPGLYLGAKLGGEIGVAVAFALLMCFYTIFNYLILIRKLIGPCLREYMMSIQPSLLSSAGMGAVVLLTGTLLRHLSLLPLFLIQCMIGIAAYFMLSYHCQRGLLSEIKRMMYG